MRVTIGKAPIDMIKDDNKILNELSDDEVQPVNIWNVHQRKSDIKFSIECERRARSRRNVIDRIHFLSTT